MDIRTLELDKVINIVKEYAVCDKTKVTFVEQISHIETNLEIISKELKNVDEFRHFIVKYGDIPLSGLYDISAALKRVEKDASLNAHEIGTVALNVELINTVKQYKSNLVNEKIPCEYLSSIIDNCIYYKNLLTEIRNCIDERSLVVDTASTELSKIRKSIKVIEVEIRQKLQEIITREKGKLNDTVITMKGDKQTLMVKNEYKNTFKGTIWGESASGESVFIEPLAVVELTNKINTLKAEEEREIARILYRLSRMIKEVVEDLKINLDSLLEIDYVHAKAKYAKSIDARIPKLNNNGVIDLKRAWHPLLNKDTVVRNDITIKNTQGLIITGPNTGGKTVTLKTLGLLTLMTQFGLLIPVSENSEIAIFDNIFADIGDEQSIEQNLSTFSSHMKNIIRILDSICTKSLVLLDELGSGTDPDEGANLAISIIEHLLKRNARLIATTHYSKLKAYAFDNELVENASVEFDVATLSPTYKLLIGVPGKSNAYEISKTLGLPESILKNAKAISKDEEDDVSKLLGKIERKSNELEGLIDQNKSINANYISLKNEYETLLNDLKENANKEVEEAKDKAKRIIKEARDEAYVIIAELNEMRKKGAVKEHEISALKGAVNKMKVEEEVVVAINKNPLQIGDIVNVLTYHQQGELISKKANKWEVKMGVLTIFVEEDLLQFIKKKPTANKGVMKTSIKKQVPLELDLRGTRFEEAAILTDKYIDDAILARIPRATIIHGYGTGAVKKAVMEVLEKYKKHITTRPGDFSEGGPGVTVILFK